MAKDQVFLYLEKVAFDNVTGHELFEVFRAHFNERLQLICNLKILNFSIHFLALPKSDYFDLLNQENLFSDESKFYLALILAIKLLL